MKQKVQALCGFYLKNCHIDLKLAPHVTFLATLVRLHVFQATLPKQ